MFWLFRLVVFFFFFVANIAGEFSYDFHPSPPSSFCMRRAHWRRRMKTKPLSSVISLAVKSQSEQFLAVLFAEADEFLSPTVDHVDHLIL